MGTCTFATTYIAPSSVGLSSEGQLVVRAKEGDEQAFSALFERHKRRVYSLCVLMTSDASLAEDLTQDAFIQVFRRLDTFRGDSAFSTWLYRVAVNTVLMSLRKRQPRQVSLDEPICADSSLLPREYGREDPQLEGAIDRIALARAIEKLPAGCRTILVLHDVEGYGHHEIARLLRCSVGNSKSQLHKARFKLRESLELRGKFGRRAPRRVANGHHASVPPRLAPEPRPERGFSLPPGPRATELSEGLHLPALKTENAGEVRP